MPVWPKLHLFAPPELFAADPEYLTAPMPKVLWIELTSKCPFDCVFCTRRVRFGAGKNLDFQVYEKLIRELDAPDFIGLNYSGESIYYPRLLEAIALAKATGAYTEIVTAFSTISSSLLREMIESGLDRLAISLHTLDPNQYQKIYRLGSVEQLKRRIDEFLEIKSALGQQTPRLDFCFVAMQENLNQLPAIAEYAKEVGVPEIFIHPIIGRHLIPKDFSIELSANQLRDGFKDALRKTISQVRESHSDLALTVLNPDLEMNPQLGHAPAYYAPKLPTPARIHTCDQSPFESVHILAGGNVVVCEVLDEISLGNLHQQSLRDIWQGEPYQAFRRKYFSDASPACRSCVWKIAYLPQFWTTRIVVADGMSPQLLRGWHAHEASGIIWSKKQAMLALKNPKSQKQVRIKGLLPPSPNIGTSSITVTVNRRIAGEIRNESADFSTFDTRITLQDPAEYLYVALDAARLYRPSLHGSSTDSRDLGFALQSVEVCG
jgi:MoaA/NifB/PqqE/SkfB family radical SAM enzyme